MGQDPRNVFAAITLLLFLSGIIIFIEGADAIGVPVITIRLDQSNQTAYVAPGDDGQVLFTGSVHVEIPVGVSDQVVVVTLTVDAGGWPCTTPPSMTFSKNVNEQSFEISVQVPTGTSSAIDGQLTVSGSWKYSPGVLGGTVDPVTSVIDIEQYFDYDLVYDYNEQSAERGMTETFDLSIVNLGNGEDTIGAEVEDIEGYAERGLTISLSSDTIVVPEGQTAEFEILISVSDDASIRMYEIDVSIRSLKADAEGEIAPVIEKTVYLDVVRESTEDEVPPEEGPEEEADDDMLPDNGQDELHYDDDADGGYNTTYPSDTDGESVNPVMAVLFFIAIVIFAVLIVAFKIGISVYFRYKVFDGFRHHAGLGRNRPLFDILADMGKRN